MPEPWAKSLVTIEQLFDLGEFAKGKVEWLRAFPQFDFSVADSTIDSTNSTFFWQWFKSMLKSEVKSMCLSDHCPNKEYIMTATGPYLTEASSLEKGETYLEAALREWLVPTPGPCGTQFTGTPPASADAVLGPQCHDLASGQNCKPYVCNGVCTHTERRFCNGIPFALPISLHHFATDGLITEPSHLPDTLTVQNKQFQLNGCTFWNGNYYNGCFRFMSQWFTYDSLLTTNCLKMKIP